MAFIWKDNEIYDELWDEEPATAVATGDAAVVQDCFGFYIKEREAAGEEVCFVYRCRQVLADKKVGTGEAIIHGDRLYAYPADGHLVSPNAVGNFGVDYYFCGWAKEDADAAATSVLMNFDGTRWDEDL